MGKITVNCNKSPNDICWETGKYSGDCNCSTCDHSYECSGSDCNNDEDDD